MNQSVLDPAGLGALHVTSLWWLFFWVCTGVFLVVAVALAVAIGHTRAEMAPPAIELHPGGDRSVQGFLFGAVGIIVFTLFALLVADFVTARRVMGSESPPDPNAVPIQVIAHQWWWEIKYPGENPSDLVTTANELHLPVGRTAHLQLSSVDVIHSFWIPSLGGKKDMIPGHPTSTWMRAERSGVFRGQCAEFCGAQHAFMDLHVIAEPPEDFNAWLAGQRRPPNPPKNFAAQLGKQIFEQTTCVLCHRVQATGAAATVGPDLTHFASRARIAGAVPNTRENLARWIVDPGATKPGVLMPPTPLNPDELTALLDYLATLK